MFHTSHMYTQFTSCRITCIVAESCHEEHGQRKDDTQSKSGPFMFKKRDVVAEPCVQGGQGDLILCSWGVSWWFESTGFWHFTTGSYWLIL